MDASAATVIAGIGAAAISGTVAIVSAHLAASRAEREAQASRVERFDDREHALLALLMPKQMESIETVWWIAFVSERDRKMTEGMIETLLRTCLWVPDELRLSILALVKNVHDDPSFGSAVVQTLADVRQRIIEISRIQRVDQFFTRREEPDNV